MTTRYGLSLKLDCGNDAFEDGKRASEIGRIFRSLAMQIEREEQALSSGHLVIGGYLFDANGNKCGEWEIKPRRIRD